MRTGNAAVTTTRRHHTHVAEDGAGALKETDPLVLLAPPQEALANHEKRHLSAPVGDGHARSAQVEQPRKEPAAKAPWRRKCGVAALSNWRGGGGASVQVWVVARTPAPET